MSDPDYRRLDAVSEAHANRTYGHRRRITCPILTLAVYREDASGDEMEIEVDIDGEASVDGCYVYGSTVDGRNFPLTRDEMEEAEEALTKHAIEVMEQRRDDEADRRSDEDRGC